MDMFELISHLASVFGPSGQEQAIAQSITALAKPYADEITADIMGNLIVHKKGAGPRVMFAAHMDSIGFIVTHIDDKGFLRFGQLGGLPANDLPGTPVRFKNGTCGTVAQEGQRKTGDVIRFQAVTVEEAHSLWRDFNRELEELKTNLDRPRSTQPHPVQPGGIAYKVTVNGRSYQVQVVKHT